MTVEQSLRQKFNEILKLRREYIHTKDRQAAIEAAGDKIFAELKAGLSTKAKPKTRRAAKKLKPAHAEN
jgi:hypothetical protein